MAPAPGFRGRWRRKLEGVPPLIQGVPLPDLHFLSWEDPFLPSVASALEVRFSRAGILDLGDALIAVPGARSGRRLLELLVDQASRTRNRLVPPYRILTVGSLPEQLYQPHLPLASGTLARRCWVRALERAPHPILSAALGPYATETDVEAKTRLARLLDSLSRTVGAAGLDFPAVAEECRRGLLFSDEERWEALGRIQGDMRSILATVGRCDREEARHRALGDGTVSCPRRLILVGIAEAPLVTRRMLARVAESILAFVQAPSAEAEAFDDLGLVAPEAWRNRSIPVAAEDLLVRDGPADQAAGVVAFLQTLEGRYSPEDITIGVPDPSLVPFLARHLESQGVATRYAEGTPLSLTPPVRLLLCSADYLGGSRFGALANLLRHPDWPPGVRPDAAPEVADAYFMDHLPDRVAPDSASSGGRGEALAGIQDALQGPDLLGALQGRGRISEWMPRILSLLATVYGDLPLDANSRFHRVVKEACLTIRDAAEELSSLPPLLDEVCSPHQALRILLGELRDARVPPEREVAAVEMVGWLELQLDDAPVVVLTGVSDPFLPESVNADLFLPNAMRTRLGLEDNRARYARDAYRLTAMVRSTRARVIVAARRNAAGDPLRPSRLLLTGGEEELALRTLQLLGDVQENNPVSRRILGSRGPGADGGFTLPPEPFIRVPVIRQPLPITAFRGLLADPYLWALHYHLMLNEAEYDLQELDPMGFGTLAHKVLEKFGRSPDASTSDPAVLKRRLHRILDSVSMERFGGKPLPTVPLQVEQLRTRLDAFAEWQATRSGEGWGILAVEARTPVGGVPFDVDGAPVFLSGRIDRIDRHRETGAWTVFDYKTGDAGTNLSTVRARTGEWKDLQLPLYRVLLQDLHLPGEVQVEPPGPGVQLHLGYLPLPKDAGPVKEVIPNWTEEDLASAEETARDVIRRLRRDGGVAFDRLRSGKDARGAMAALLGHGILQTSEADE